MSRKKSSVKKLGRRKANGGIHLGMKHAKAHKSSRKKYHKGKAY